MTTRAALAGLVFALAFFSGIASVRFYNDHFEHLATAQQALYGEYPGRDYRDPRPLTTLTSAVVEKLFGHSLLGEAMLTTAAIAVGIAIVFFFSAGITGSTLAGIVAALLPFLLAPRLYAYPKILLLPMAAWLFWRALERPDAGRFALLGGLWGLAFLFRHDFLLYVGVLVLALSATALVRDGLGACLLGTAIAGGAALIVAAPFVLWLAAQSRLGSIAEAGADDLRRAARVTLRPFEPAPVLEVAEPPLRAINVRWSPRVDAERRAELERHHGLTRGREIDPEHRTWEYELLDDPTALIGSLVDDPDVEDTSGIDRSRRRLAEPAWLRLQRRFALLRLRSPFLVSVHNAQNIVYDLFLLLPVLGIILAILVPSRDRSPEASTRSATIAGLSAFCFVCVLFLVRGSLDSRLPDVAAPEAILFVWVGATLARAAGPWHPTARLLARLALAAAGLLVCHSALIVSGQGLSGRLAPFGSPIDAWAQSVRELRSNPVDLWGRRQPGNYRDLIGYLRRCTTPSHHVFVFGYHPDVFWVSQRPFAGGVVGFHGNNFSTVPEQREVVARLGRQDVPVVLVDTREAARLEHGYSILAEHVRQRYGPARQPGGGRFLVLTERDRVSAGTSPVPGLPCFSTAGSPAPRAVNRPEPTERDRQLAPPNHPRRSSALAISSTGETVKASATTITPSMSDRP